MEIKDLLDKDGWEFEASFNGKYGVGRITIDKDEVFLCQNIEDGFPCKDKKGFKYSYVLLQKHLNGAYGFNNFKLISSSIAQKAIKNNNWYIRGSEEFAEFLKLGFIKKGILKCNSEIYTYYIYKGELSWNFTHNTTGYSGKTLVTVQDLKNYYMKDKVVEYYELLKDLPNVSKGEKFYLNTEREGLYSVNNKQGTFYSKDTIKNAPEWFKAHYKDVVPEISKYKLEKVGGAIWKFGCTEFDWFNLNDLYHNSKIVFKTKNELSFNVSGHTISMQKLEEIVNYIKSNS